MPIPCLDTCAEECCWYNAGCSLRHLLVDLGQNTALVLASLQRICASIHLLMVPEKRELILTDLDRTTAILFRYQPLLCHLNQLPWNSPAVSEPYRPP